MARLAAARAGGHGTARGIAGRSLLALAGGAAVLIAIAGIGLVILDALNRKRLPFSAAESLALAPLVGRCRSR